MKRYLSIMALPITIFALALPVAVPAAPRPQPVPAATPAPAPHPEIREALEGLRKARVHLQEAAHDFGGHRAEALKATDDAIRQLNICLQYDK